MSAGEAGAVVSPGMGALALAEVARKRGVRACLYVPPDPDLVASLQALDAEVRTLPLNRLAPLRRSHRLALPLLAPAFSRLRIDADVVVCSSSGWAHGARVEGRKIVYCHTPARWLYQPERYLRGRAVGLRGVAAVLRPQLVRWDKAAAASADLYLANSSAVAARIADIYGLEAEVLPPPPALTPAVNAAPVEGVEPGFALCVSRPDEGRQIFLCNRPSLS